MKTYPITWPERISADSEVVDAHLVDTTSTPAPTVADLENAIQWLALYGAADHEDAQPFIRVIGLLQAKIADHQRRADIAQAKRAYAATHGVRVSSVRIAR